MDARRQYVYPDNYKFKDIMLLYVYFTHKLPHRIHDPILVPLLTMRYQPSVKTTKVMKTISNPLKLKLVERRPLFSPLIEIFKHLDGITIQSSLKGSFMGAFNEMNRNDRHKYQIRALPNIRCR